MKDFIEVKSAINQANLLLSISSIALIEEYPANKTRIVMKEGVEANGNNLEVICTMGYHFIKNLIMHAQ